MKTPNRIKKEDAVGAVCLLLRDACENNGMVFLWRLEHSCNWNQRSSRVYAELLVYAGVFTKRDTPGCYELTTKALRLIRRLNSGWLQKGEQMMEDLFGPQNSVTAEVPKTDVANKGVS